MLPALQVLTVILVAVALAPARDRD